jgi:cyclophilin family peptidyl-prolyl cis-trans isomerase
VGAAFALAPLLGVLACGDGESEPSGPTAVVVEGPHDVAVITVRDMGVIRVELLPELAPKTVENFVKLANEGFYDGTTFHRVIPDFMIQGGDPASKNRDPRDDGKGGAGYTIPDEYTDFPQVRGVVSMAHAGPETASCQFFIVRADSPHLDGKYTAFGRVVEGIEVVDAITKVPLDTYGRYGPENRPHPDQVVMHSIRIEPAGAS